MNPQKKLFQKATAAGLCAALAAGLALPVCAQGAAAKDENVYATLEQDGSVSGIYVVNEFSSETGGALADYGNYTEVKNLTDQSELTLADGCVSGTLPQGKFYYQGNLADAALPWEISIRYELDGQPIDAQELAGRSGALCIRIETRQNPAGNAAFFEHYLLQATVVLDTALCTNIQAEGATAGNVGTNRQLVYTLLPGTENTVEITADVVDFSMEGITFQGVPFTLDLGASLLDGVDLDLGSQTKELTDAVAQLDDGVAELKKGTAAAADGGVQLADGVAQLANGSGALAQGGTALAGGAAALAGGAAQLQSGVGQYLDGVSAFAVGVQQYVGGVAQLAEGSSQLAALESLPLVHDAIGQMYQAVAVGDAAAGVPSLQAGAAGLASGLEQIHTQVALLAETTDLSGLQELLAGVAQIQETVAGLADGAAQVGAAIEGSAQLAGAVESYHQAVLGGLAAQAETANARVAAASAAVQAAMEAIRSCEMDEAARQAALAELETALAQLDGIALVMPEENAELQAAIGQLNDVAAGLQGTATQFRQAADALQTAAGQMAAALASGSQELNDGASQLADGLATLDGGVSLLNGSTGALTDGLAALDDGVAQLKEGTGTFRAETSGLDGKIRQQIEQMLEDLAQDDFEPVSFTSDRNTGIGLVQFAITAQGIQLPEAEAQPQEEAEPGFLDRLLKLFFG